MDILVSILCGTVGATIFSGIFAIINKKIDRKAVKEDRAEEKADKKAERESDMSQYEKKLDEFDTRLGTVELSMKSLIVANRTILYDKIKNQGRQYLSDGKISSEDLKDLIDMHRVYHNDLGGNGFLDALMEKVRELPIKP